MKALELTGERFGEWSVLERAPNSKTGHTRWKCCCSCGNKSVVDAQSLRSGKSSRCTKCRAKNKKGHYTQGSRATVLYFIRAGDYIKIGVTSNLQQRLKTMQPDNPHDLEVIWQEPNEEGLEEFYHKLYQHRHRHGEWFEFKEEDAL